MKDLCRKLIVYVGGCACVQLHIHLCEHMLRSQRKPWILFLRSHPSWFYFEMICVIRAHQVGETSTRALLPTSRMAVASCHVWLLLEGSGAQTQGPGTSQTSESLNSSFSLLKDVSFKNSL